jgi:hypothetical protein
LIHRSRKENIPLGELVTNIAEKLATVLSQGNDKAKKIMTFCLREMIRHIPEHSQSLSGWY